MKLYKLYPVLALTERMGDPEDSSLSVEVEVSPLEVDLRSFRKFVLLPTLLYLVFCLKSLENNGARFISTI